MRQARQALLQLAIVQVRVPRQARQRRELVVAAHDHFGTVLGGEDLCGARRVVKQMLQRRLDRIGVHVVARHAVHLDPGRCGQHQPLDALRVRHRERRRDPSAERRSDDGEALDRELVEQVEIVEDEVVDAVEPVRPLALAEPEVIGCQDMKARRQGIVIRGPHVGAELRVQDQQRPPAPTLEDVCAHAADIEPVAAVGHAAACLYQPRGRR